MGDLDSAAARRRVVRIRLGQPEVEDLHRAVERQLDVSWLEVPLHDTVLVGVLEALGDLLRDRDRIVDRDGAVAESRGEVLAFDQLEREGDDAVRLLEAVDGGDPGMVERGEDVRFAPQAGDALAVLREGGRQHLDRNVASELGIPRTKHLAHAACAEGREHLVGTESDAGSEGHGFAGGETRRSSSKKFWINTTLSRFSSDSCSAAFSTAMRWPSGCRSKARLAMPRLDTSPGDH